MWLYINEQLDLEDKLNGLCPQCYHEVTEEVHCTRCGALIEGEHDDIEAGIDEGFDMDRYERLKNGEFKFENNNDEQSDDNIQLSAEELPLFYEDDTPEHIQIDVNDGVNDEECEIYTDIFELIANINEYEDELNNEQHIEGE